MKLEGLLPREQKTTDDGVTRRHIKKVRGNMGMDLITRINVPSIRPTKHYTNSGWRKLVGFLEKHGVDTSEFSEFNDGELISGRTCRAVATVIEENSKELEDLFDEGVDEDITFWSNCGGCYQC